MREISSKEKDCHSSNCDSQKYRVCEKSYVPIIAERFANVKHGIKIEEV